LVLDDCGVSDDFGFCGENHSTGTFRFLHRTELDLNRGINSQEQIKLSFGTRLLQKKPNQIKMLIKG
jgi:hypothetical protein